MTHLIFLHYSTWELLLRRKGEGRRSLGSGNSVGVGAAKGLKTAGLVAPKSRPSEGDKRTEASGYVDLMSSCRLMAMRSREKPWNKVQRASKARPVPARWNVTILRGIDTGKIVRTCKEYRRNAALRAAFWAARPSRFLFL